MISLSDIRHLHLELSSYCNARCPKCARNFQGYPANLGYAEKHLTLEIIEKRLDPNFVKQLTGVNINGNLGDFVMNPESQQIIEYFLQHNPNIKISVSTNGSARSQDFWQSLGKLGITIRFCLDGLSDTHHIYRADTNFDKIIANAQTFIQSGGKAIWKMILFDHNSHQVDQCRDQAKQLGFVNFEINDHGRDNGVVFDKQGKFSHIIGKPKQPIVKKLDIALKLMQHQTEWQTESFDTTKKPACWSKLNRSIYIDSEARVYPCCWLGFSPLTYDKNFIGFVNKNIKPLIEKNSLYEYALSDCIKWFDKVESKWDITDYNQGRIYMCDTNCHPDSRAKVVVNQSLL